MRQRISPFVAIICLYWGPLAYASSAAEIAPIPADIPPEVLSQIRDLHASSPRKKVMAIRRLGEIGPDAGAAAPYLIELLDSQEKYLSITDKFYNAISILGSSGIYVMHETRTALIRIGPPAVDPLISALNHPRPKVRGNAALTLGLIRDTQAIAPLISALKDAEPEVRMWAAEALGEMPNSQSVRPLIAALRDTDQHVRSYVAFSLGKSGDLRAVEPLIQSLREGNNAAGPALHEITGERFGADAEKWQEWWSRNKAAKTR
jgi:hypothetical protein